MAMHMHSTSALLEPELQPPVAGHPRVGGLGVATPSEVFTQDQMLDLLGLRGNDFAEGIFARCGVRTRRLETSSALLRTTLQERTPATEDQLLRMALGAVDTLCFDPSDLGVVVSASLYSLGGPTLAHRLVEHLELDPAVDKYHLLGVGCASAVPLFRIAGQALRDRPGQSALVVAAESITGFLTAAEAGDPRAKVVGSALFGDGCAAALLRLDGDGAGPAVLASAVHQVPGTLDHVHFEVTGADSHMQISRELPDLAQTAIGGLVDGFLRPRGLEPGAIEHWLVHPGGRGIIEGVRAGLGLTDEQVAVSTQVLADVGNVGTPASMFVLERTLAQRRPAPGELGLMVTIGPGVTVGLMLLGF
jgi:predicted naringenin-chalcone synthase